MDKPSAGLMAGAYALGRQYLKSGFYAPAERIFSGLVELDSSATPAQLALGVTRFERGKFAEAINIFRDLIQRKVYLQQAQIGLSCCYLAQGEQARAKAMLDELPRVENGTPPELQQLRGSLLSLCQR